MAAAPSRSIVWAHVHGSASFARGTPRTGAPTGGIACASSPFNTSHTPSSTERISRSTGGSHPKVMDQSSSKSQAAPPSRAMTCRPTIGSSSLVEIAAIVSPPRGASRGSITSRMRPASSPSSAVPQKDRSFLRSGISRAALASATQTEISRRRVPNCQNAPSCRTPMSSSGRAISGSRVRTSSCLMSRPIGLRTMPHACLPQERTHETRRRTHVRRALRARHHYPRDVVARCPADRNRRLDGYCSRYRWRIRVVIKPHCRCVESRHGVGLGYRVCHRAAPRSCGPQA